MVTPLLKRLYYTQTYSDSYTEATKPSQSKLNHTAYTQAVFYWATVTIMRGHFLLALSTDSCYK